MAAVDHPWGTGTAHHHLRMEEAAGMAEALRHDVIMEVVVATAVIGGVTVLEVAAQTGAMHLDQDTRGDKRDSAVVVLIGIYEFTVYCS